MSLSAISLLVVTALLVIHRGWMGWRDGATREVRILLVNLFGVLVAFRFWQPWTAAISEGVKFDPRWIAIGAFLVLYAIGVVVAGFVARIKAPAYQSVKADSFNQALGLAGGVFSGLLIGGCIAWVTFVARPTEASPAANALRALPQAIVQDFESVSGMRPGSSGRTQFPQVALVEVPAESSADATGGAVLMRQRGNIEWR
jgi:hypothetical protein